MERMTRYILGKVVDELGNNDAPEPEPTQLPDAPLEQLIAILIPKAHLMKGVLVSDRQTFFDTYMDSFAATAEEVYGPLVRTFEEDEGILRYSLTNEVVTIEYNVGVHAEASAKGQGAENKMIYIGGLTIKQEEVDLEKAGALLRGAKEYALLVYRPKNESPAIYLIRDPDTIKRNAEVLEDMDVEFTAGIQFYGIRGKGMWLPYKPIQKGVPTI
jgi:hypothetical protein